MQNAHLALIDALMTLAAKETVGRVEMAAEAEQMGAGAPWENALLFWVNRVRPCGVGTEEVLPKPEFRSFFRSSSCPNTTRAVVSVASS